MTRSVKPESELLRCVARESPGGVVEILPDPKRRLPGRGAWITPNVETVELAQKRRAFERALRVQAPVDTSQVKVYLSS